MNGKQAKRIRKMVWAGDHGVTPDMKQYKFKQVATRVLFYQNRGTSTIIDVATFYTLPKISSKIGETSQLDYADIPVSKPVECDDFHKTYRQWKKLYTRHEA